MTNTAIILGNKIILVNDYSMITASIVVPARNISRMIAITDAYVVSKKEITLPNNNNAGVIYMVTIRVQFSKIRNFLNRKNIYECENKNAFIEMLNKDAHINAYTNSHLLSEDINLYAFGDLYVAKNYNFNAIYYNKEGKKISVCHDKWNNHGGKRYIKLKGVWYSNKKF